MDNLDQLATTAVAKARIKYPQSAKLGAIKLLREATGMGLSECAPYINAAWERPSCSLTRADKAAMVAELSRRLSAASENRAYADMKAWKFAKDNDVDYFQRQQHRLQGAILRIAMAKTID